MQGIRKKKIYTTSESEEAGLPQGRGGGLMPGGGGPKRQQRSRSGHMVCSQASASNLSPWQQRTSHARGRRPHARWGHAHRSASAWRHPHWRTHRGPHARGRAHHTCREGTANQHTGGASDSTQVEINDMSSHLEAGLLCPSGAGLLGQVGIVWERRRCSLLLLPRQPSLCPVESSPGDKQEVVINRAHARIRAQSSRCHSYLLRRTAHTSDGPGETGRRLRHRRSCGDATTCCPTHTWTASHAGQWDTGNAGLKRGRSYTAQWIQFIDTQTVSGHPSSHWLELYSHLSEAGPQPSWRPGSPPSAEPDPEPSSLLAPAALSSLACGKNEKVCKNTLRSMYGRHYPACIRNFKTWTT